MGSPGLLHWIVDLLAGLEEGLREHSCLWLGSLSPTMHLSLRPSFQKRPVFCLGTVWLCLGLSPGSARELLPGMNVSFPFLKAEFFQLGLKGSAGVGVLPVPFLLAGGHTQLLRTDGAGQETGRRLARCSHTGPSYCGLLWGKQVCRVQLCFL